MSVAGAERRHESQEGTSLLKGERDHRFFDRKFNATAVKVLPGRYYVTSDPQEMIVTVLGSCVAACIRDPVLGLGGMNHFMFPEGAQRCAPGSSMAERYGTFAMEVLINEVLKRGGRRERLEVKVFGGANVINSSFKVGSDNGAFVRHYLEREGLPILSQDLGGEHPRRIHYFPKSGKVMRMFLQRSRDREVFEEERKATKRLAGQKLGGDVELFE